MLCVSVPCSLSTPNRQSWELTDCLIQSLQIWFMKPIKLECAEFRLFDFHCTVPFILNILRLRRDFDRVWLLFEAKLFPRIEPICSGGRTLRNGFGKWDTIERRWNDWLTLMMITEGDWWWRGKRFQMDTDGVTINGWTGRPFRVTLINLMSTKQSLGTVNGPISQVPSNFLYALRLGSLFSLTVKTLLQTIERVNWSISD